MLDKSDSKEIILMADIVNNDKLIWIYTDYGLNRITEMMANPEDSLFLQKIKVGDANGSYYIPSSAQTQLVNEKETFFIHNKELIEDPINPTVSFFTVFPENSSGYDIREVGLYETLNGIDYLFAISTMQPLVKPSVQDNYVISVDYEISLISKNLAYLYDRIVLDADNEYVNQATMEQLKATFLFIEGNLMEQISNNTHIIGLNRASQLNERINDDILTYSATATALNYTNLLNFTTIDKIASYWIFNYSKYLTGATAIVDLSSNGYNLTLNKNTNLFQRKYIGLASQLDINSPNYFTLGDDVNFDLLAPLKDTDSPFTWFFIIEPDTMGTKNTWLAKSDYFNSTHIFEINKLSDNSLEVKLFTDKDNYITYTTPSNTIPITPSVISVSYNGSIQFPVFSLIVNYSKINGQVVNTGIYTGMKDIKYPLASYTVDSNGNPQDYINSKISVISLVKDNFDESHTKSLMLNLLAYAGQNPCLVV